MKSKKIIPISIILLLVVYGLIAFILNERASNALINPDIYPAFRKIENHALLYIQQKIVDREEYERSKALVIWMEEESEQMVKSRDDYSVSAEEYYNFLIGLGFNLPPFRLKTPPTEEQENQAMVEQSRLFKIQLKIIEDQINKDLREIEESRFTDKEVIN